MINNIKEDIKNIIYESIWAPSGDNAQPWRFEVENNAIKVFVVPERDTSLYNFNQNASLVAIGALIENIKISSMTYGYRTSINLFPKEDNFNLIATILLEKSEAINHPLYPYIKERVTNRKPYKTGPILKEHIDEILKLEKKYSDIFIVLNDNRNDIEKLTQLTSLNEKIVLENKNLHDFLFNHITWSEKADLEKKGFFIKTLELKGPQLFAFKLFRFWWVLNLFNKIGVSNLVAKDNAKIYKQSGAFIAIISNDNSKISFLKSGMLTQEFWLLCTKFNISVQPLTGIPFLYHRIIKEEKESLSKNHIALIKDAYIKIKNIFNIKDQEIIMMFRIGYASKPSARCKRLEPDIVFL
jgi:hypothetical protein